MFAVLKFPGMLRLPNIMLNRRRAGVFVNIEGKIGKKATRVVGWNGREVMTNAYCITFRSSQKCQKKSKSIAKTTSI
ncbi:hypothetical protein CK934_27095 [Chitinophaga sp. MD30]|nr:hypothetical protein CK934_27095 [Chitinophaga sp. MD30]